MKLGHGTALGRATAVVWLAWGSTAWAVVDTIDATATAEAEEFIGSDVVNTDLAFESLDETTGNLPLIVEAGFERFDDLEDAVAVVEARTVFSDPRLSETLNPKEFGLEVSAFSLDASTFHQGRAEATETREITFLSEELGNLADGTPVEAISQFFLDGLIAVWGNLDDLEPGEVFGRVNLSVQQSALEGEASPTTVLEATITLTSDSDGTPVLTVTGALTADNVILIDASSVLPELDHAFFVLIPEIGIPYTYEAVVGETFTLDARIEASIADQPDTGAGVTLGLEFDQIADAIEGQIGEALPLPLLDILQVASGSALLAAKPLPRKATTEVHVLDPGTILARRLGLPVCGASGVEMALMAGVFPLALVGRRRWR